MGKGVGWVEVFEVLSFFFILFSFSLSRVFFSLSNSLGSPRRAGGSGGGCPWGGVGSRRPRAPWRASCWWRSLLLLGEEARRKRSQRGKKRRQRRRVEVEVEIESTRQRGVASSRGPTQARMELRWSSSSAETRPESSPTPWREGEAAWLVGNEEKKEESANGLSR